MVNQAFIIVIAYRPRRRRRRRRRRRKRPGIGRYPMGPTMMMMINSSSGRCEAKFDQLWKVHRGLEGVKWFKG